MTSWDWYDPITRQWFKPRPGHPIAVEEVPSGPGYSPGVIKGSGALPAPQFPSKMEQVVIDGPKGVMSYDYAVQLQGRIVTHRKTEGRTGNPIKSLARQVASMPRGPNAVFPPEGARKLRFLAAEYAQACSSVNVVLKAKGVTAGPNSIVNIVQGEPSWGKRAARRTIRRLQSIRVGTRAKGVTFTIRKMEGRSPAEDFRLAQSAWNIVLTRLRREAPGVKFLKVFELGRGNTNVHIHAVFWGAAIPDENWFRHCWELASQGSYQVHLSDRNVGPDYAVKYLLKGYNKKQEPGIEALFMWACSVRRYACSQGLLPAVVSEWEWLGYVFGTEGKWLHLGPQILPPKQSAGPPSQPSPSIPR